MARSRKGTKTGPTSQKVVDIIHQFLRDPTRTQTSLAIEHQYPIPAVSRLLERHLPNWRKIRAWNEIHPERQIPREFLPAWIYED